MIMVWYKYFQKYITYCMNASYVHGFLVLTKLIFLVYEIPDSWYKYFQKYITYCMNASYVHGFLFLTKLIFLVYEIPDSFIFLKRCVLKSM